MPTDRPTDSQLEIGCSSLCFARLPRQEAIALIAGMGFRWIDIGMLRRFNVGEAPFQALHFDPLTAGDADVHSLRDELEDAGLSTATANVGGGYLNLAWEHDVAVEYARAAIRACAALQGYAITIQSGKLLRGTDWVDNVRHVAPAMRALASYAATHGVELHVEGPHIEMLTHDLRTTVDFLEIVDHDNLFITLDPSHIVVAHEDPIAVTRALGAHVRHVHVRDGTSESPVIVPGQGDIDWLALTSLLVEIGYVRPVMIELCQDESDEYEVSRARFIEDTEVSRDYMYDVLNATAPR